jgi:hypothetical protein
LMSWSVCSFRPSKSTLLPPTVLARTLRASAPRSLLLQLALLSRVGLSRCAYGFLRSPTPSSSSRWTCCALSRTHDHRMAFTKPVNQRSAVLIISGIHQHFWALYGVRREAHMKACSTYAHARSLGVVSLCAHTAAQRNHGFDCPPCSQVLLLCFTSSRYSARALCTNRQHWWCPTDGAALKHQSMPRCRSSAPYLETSVDAASLRSTVGCPSAV